MKTEYLDFELEIGPGQGREYPVAVLRSPSGEARGTMQFPYSDIQLEGRLKDLQIALLRSGGTRRTALTKEQRDVQDFGQALFDALVAGDVRSLYNVSQEKAGARGLRIKLRIADPGLAALPWEFLYDPRRRDYVCLSTYTPLVRYLDLPQPPQPLTVEPPLRVLGMIASPSDLMSLDVERERERVERAVASLRRDGLVELEWLPGQTWRDLQRTLRQGPWHVFHFVGHGAFDANADEGLVMVCDDAGKARPLRATELGRFLANHRSLRLAVLNACEGGKGSEKDIFSSTASLLVRAGLPAVLAMQYEITDRAAIELSRVFYEAIADGYPVDAAVAEARVAVSVAATNTVEWGTPVLYMRAPDGVIFNIGAPGALAAGAGRSQTVAAPPADPTMPSIPPSSGGRALPPILPRSRSPWWRGWPLALVAVLAAVALIAYMAARSGGFPGRGEPPPDSGLVVVATSQVSGALTLPSDTPVLPTDTPESAGDAPVLLADEPALFTATPAPPADTPVPPTDTPVPPTDTLVPLTATPALGIGSTMISEKDDMEMVYVPAGEFTMGSPEGEGASDEHPQHTVYLDAFWIDKTEVTAAQYQRCVEAGGCSSPNTGGFCTYGASGKADHPINCVDWKQAVAYCAWAGKRLPTEAEWEKAARGTDGRVYPWGDARDAGWLNSADGGPGRTTAVGSYPAGASPYGALDMAGNVWEWVADWYDGSYYGQSPSENPLGPSSGQYRVLRGGSWYSSWDFVRAALRNWVAPVDRDDYSGFRCARSP